MATVRKVVRRNGTKAKKWTCYFIGEDGARKNQIGMTDKAESLAFANHLEAEAKRVRLGMVDADEKARHQALLRSPKDHCEDYKDHLLRKGDTPKHALRTFNALKRLIDLAGIGSLKQFTPDRIEKGIAKMKEAGSSPRSCNFYLGAAKALAVWLDHANRIKEVPRGLKAIRPINEAEDRRRVRRTLSRDEIARLLAATEAGPPRTIRRTRKVATKVGPAVQGTEISGPERAALYRLALGTGFRAEELRTLSPERFQLDGPEPTVTVLATYSKNGKEAVQPITRELAEAIRPFVAGKPPGSPAIPFPVEGAEMIRSDLARAGIPIRDAEGRVADFHCLRHTFITLLVRTPGVSVKDAQDLARHSTPLLTLGRYTSTSAKDKRRALEAANPPTEPEPPGSQS